MSAPDRIYTDGDYSGSYRDFPLNVWQTEYIRADKVYKALEELKSIQAYIEATNSDNSFLMAKVQSAIKEIEG
jgi:hypothetical protein